MNILRTRAFEAADLVNGTPQPSRPDFLLIGCFKTRSHGNHKREGFMRVLNLPCVCFREAYKFSERPLRRSASGRMLRTRAWS